MHSYTAIALLGTYHVLYETVYHVERRGTMVLEGVQSQVPIEPVIRICLLLTSGTKGGS